MALKSSSGALWFYRLAAISALAGVAAGAAFFITGKKSPEILSPASQYPGPGDRGGEASKDGHGEGESALPGGILPGSGWEDVIARAAPAVANIYSSRLVASAPTGSEIIFQNLFGFSPPRPTRRQTDLGSAVVVDERGYLLTNHHLVSRASEISVELPGKGQFQARLVGSDSKTDLAVLQIVAGQGEAFSAVQAGKSAGLRIGELVFAIGNPLGVGQTVTHGIISATGRDTGNPYANFIQTDAAINPGNSGGALINSKGQLVGINSFIYSRSGGSDGLGFAIPVELAIEVAYDIIRYGKVKRGWIGYLTYYPLKKDGSGGQSGLLVREIDPNGPAFKGGLRVNDLIVSIDQKPATHEQMVRRIALLKPGEKIEFKSLKEGRVISQEIVAEQLPQSPD